MFTWRLACLLGLGVWRIYENHQLAKQKSASQEAELLSRPVPVQVAPAERKPMPIYLTALGTVTPYMSVTVKARVSGELVPVKFTEGQQVKQGQTIMVDRPQALQGCTGPGQRHAGPRRGAAERRAGGVYALQSALRRGRDLKGDAGRRRGQHRASIRAQSRPTRQRLRPRSCSSTGAPFSRLSTGVSACGWWIPATSSPPTRPTW